LNLSISEKAASWFKSEMMLDTDDYVRLYVKFGGCSAVQQGFSLGISTDEPEDPAVQLQHKGITYYIEERDLWYFDGHDLHINFNTELEEPDYIYNK
jgi:uncharacterized protein YneR